MSEYQSTIIKKFFGLSASKWHTDTVILNEAEAAAFVFIQELSPA
jgi:hypothetical protein